MLELKVKMVALDQNNNSVVLLTDIEEKLVLPIWVGAFEAQAIAISLQGETPPRPLTHDLLTACCQETGSTIDKVIITDITPEWTYLAEVHLIHDQQTKIIDSRPSDAIAIALRNKAPIYMTGKLVEFTEDVDKVFPGNDEKKKLH